MGAGNTIARPSRLVERVCAAVWLTLLLLLPNVTAAQTVRVSMSASSSRVQVGEPFAVEIRADVTGADVDEIELPDFGALEVLGRQTSRPFSFSFGFGTGGRRAHVQSQIIHSFTLRALEPGTFKIAPAIVVAGGRRFASQPLTINASGDALPNAPSGQSPDEPQQPQAPDSTAPPEGPLNGAEYNPDAFVRTVVDKQEAFVGEQVTVSVYLYLHGSLTSAPAVTKEPTADGFWVEDLLPPNRNLTSTRQIVNGRGFNVYLLRRFAAFPLRPGELTIGATSLEMGGGPSIFDLLTGPTGPVRRTGVKTSVLAKELPQKANKNTQTIVGQITLTSTLEPQEIAVGDAATLTLNVRGSGNLKALSFEVPTLAGVDVLKPEVSDRVTTDFDVVGGERTLRWLLIGRAPGEVAIPTFSISELDPKTSATTERTTAPLTLRIKGQAAAAPASAAQAPNESTRDKDAADVSFGPARRESALLRKDAPLHHAPWFWVTLAVAPLLVLGNAGLSVLRKRRASSLEATRGERALSEAQSKLDTAHRLVKDGDARAACSQIASAIRVALEARLGEALLGLTYPALRSHLSERGMGSMLVERIVKELEGSESARFSPILPNAGELATMLERSRGLLREIASFTPKEKT